MMQEFQLKSSLTRRDMLTQCGQGLGMLALASLSANEVASAELSSIQDSSKTHHPASAKQVVHLFMNGGPSHMDTFDPKPILNKYHGKPLPNPALPTERKTAGALGSPFKCRRHVHHSLDAR